MVSASHLVSSNWYFVTLMTILNVPLCYRRERRIDGQTAKFLLRECSDAFKIVANFSGVRLSVRMLIDRIFHNLIIFGTFCVLKSPIKIQYAVFRAALFTRTRVAQSFILHTWRKWFTNWSFFREMVKLIAIASRKSVLVVLLPLVFSPVTNPKIFIVP